MKEEKKEKRKGDKKKSVCSTKQMQIYVKRGYKMEEKGKEKNEERREKRKRDKTKSVCSSRQMPANWLNLEVCSSNNKQKQQHSTFIATF